MMNTMMRKKDVFFTCTIRHAGKIMRNGFMVLTFILASVATSPANASSFLDGLIPSMGKSAQDLANQPPKSTEDIIKELTKKFDIPFGDIKTVVLTEIAKAPFEEPSVIQNLDRLNIASESLTIGNDLLQRMRVSSDTSWPQDLVDSGPNVRQLLKQFDREGLYDLQKDFLKISPIRIFSANVKNKICRKNKYGHCRKQKNGEFKLHRVKAKRGNSYKNIVMAAISFTKDPGTAKKDLKGYYNAINIYKIENAKYEKFKTAYEVKKKAGKTISKTKRADYKAMLRVEKKKLKALEDKSGDAEDVVGDWEDKVFDHIKSIKSNKAIDPSDKVHLALAKNIYAVSTLVAEIDGAAVVVLAVAIAKTPGAMINLPSEIKDLSVQALAGMKHSKIAKKRLAHLKSIGTELPESIGEIYAQLKPQTSLALRLSSAFSDKFNLTSINNMKGGLQVVLESEEKVMNKHVKVVKKEISHSKEEITINKKLAWVYENHTSKSPRLNAFHRGDSLVVLEKRNEKKGKDFWIRVAKNNADGGDGWLWSGKGKIHTKTSSSSLFGGLF